MAPEPRPIPRFIAEPPHEGRPYGRWADSLAIHFLEACQQIETDEDLGDPGQVVWFPDRTFAGRTYIPATVSTSTGYELLGYVSYTREHEGAEAPSPTRASTGPPGPATSNRSPTSPTRPPRPTPTGSSTYPTAS